MNFVIEFHDLAAPFFYRKVKKGGIQMKTMTKGKGQMLIVTGGLALVYILLELYFEPYLQKLSAATFITYNFYFIVFIRPVGILAISIFILKLLQYKKVFRIPGKRIFLAAGLILYGIYFLLLIWYLCGGLPSPLEQILYRIYTNTYVFWIPALMIGLGLK